MEASPYGSSFAPCFSERKSEGAKWQACHSKKAQKSSQMWEAKRATRPRSGKSAGPQPFDLASLALPLSAKTWAPAKTFPLMGETTHRLWFFPQLLAPLQPLPCSVCRSSCPLNHLSVHLHASPSGPLAQTLCDHSSWKVKQKMLRK